jgi:hypothetical protein
VPPVPLELGGQALAVVHGPVPSVPAVTTLTRAASRT